MKPKVGWEHPHMAKRQHFFVEKKATLLFGPDDKMRSLCGKFEMVGQEMEQTHGFRLSLTPLSTGDGKYLQYPLCTICKRKAEKSGLLFE